MAVLVTGGAGYIGSHLTHALADADEKIVVVDNLATGMQALVAPDAVFVQGDASDAALVKKLISEHGVTAVIHLAAFIDASRSVNEPLVYYANNTLACTQLLDACVQSGVEHFLFSSSAAVYGQAERSPIGEDCPPGPLSPYGRSKMMAERILDDAARAHGLRYVVLRHFNVAGADALGRAGPSSARAGDFIKRACQAALGRLPYLEIFGIDHATPDGTGVRDYVHVSDLVAAHGLALGYLRNGGEPLICNCGYGRGFSVRQVIEAVEKISGRKLNVRAAPRRKDDPASLVADSTRIRRAINWVPAHDNLEEIVRSTYAWERRLNSN